MYRRTRGIIISALAAVIFAGTGVGAASAAPVPGETAPETVVITANSVVFTLTTAAGTEEVVSLEKFAAEAGKTPALVRGVPGGGMTTNAVGRIEGNWYKTSNIYFNRDETNRIAAGAGVLYMLPAGVPSVVVQAIRAAAGAVVVWAGLAIVSGSCVGIKTPISIGPRVPLAIYHRSGFCF